MGLLKSASLRYAGIAATPGLAKGGLRSSAPTITGAPPAATVGTPYTFNPTAAGGRSPYSFALSGSLPSGLIFSTATGAISGTPTTAQTKTGLNITVTDAAGATASLGGFSLTAS